jgi:hypothetical protein
VSVRRREIARPVATSRPIGIGLELAPFDVEEEAIMLRDESGRVGYLVLYLLGAPIGLLLLLWVIFGNNLIGPG